MPKRSEHNYPLIIWPALLIVCLDQASKLAVQGSLKVYESVPIINGFFNMVHVRNRGMAFGFLNRPDIKILYHRLEKDDKNFGRIFIHFRH